MIEGCQDVLVTGSGEVRFKVPLVARCGEENLGQPVLRFVEGEQTQRFLDWLDFKRHGREVRR